MYAQLGARGTSVLFASGDSGVAGTFFNNPANCTDREFVPTFPASCPLYVLRFVSLAVRLMGSSVASPPLAAPKVLARRPPPRSPPEVSPTSSPGLRTRTRQ